MNPFAYIAAAQLAVLVPLAVHYLHPWADKYLYRYAFWHYKPFSCPPCLSFWLTLPACLLPIHPVVGLAFAHTASVIAKLLIKRPK